MNLETLNAACVKPWRSKKYRDDVASQGCLVCRKKAVACHTGPHGTSTKAPDWTCVPLCDMHHKMLDGHRKLPNGEIGPRAFQRFYGVNIKAAAEVYYRVWQMNQQGKKRRVA